MNVPEWKNRNTEHLHASCQQIVLIIKRAKANAGAVFYSKYEYRTHISVLSSSHMAQPHSETNQDFPWFGTECQVMSVDITHEQFERERTACLDEPGHDYVIGKYRR